MPRTLIQPDSREIYLLVAGLVGGIILSPAILGRVSPTTHNKWFPSLESAQKRIISEQMSAQAIKAIAETRGLDASLAITADQLKVSDDAIETLSRAQAHRSRLFSLIFVMVAVMIVEIVANNVHELTKLRLARARYVLAAIFLALLLAQPTVMMGMNAMFLLLLTAVTLLGAWMPTIRDRSIDP